MVLYVVASLQKMKPIEVKIPVAALIITGVIIIASVIVTTVIITNGNVKRKLKGEVILVNDQYQQYKTEAEKIISQKEDTIQYYKNIVFNRDERIRTLNGSITSLKNKLSEIPAEASKYTPNELYEELQKVYGEKTDTLEYPFSGNQVTEIYVEHKYANGLAELTQQYEYMIVEYINRVDASDKQIGEQDKLLEIRKSMLEESEKNAQILYDKFLKEQKRKKIWRATSAIGTVAGIGIGLLI